MANSLTVAGISSLFGNVGDKRKDLYRSAAKTMALNGCFDDAQFMLDLIKDDTDILELMGIEVIGG